MDDENIKSKVIILLSTVAKNNQLFYGKIISTIEKEIYKLMLINKNIISKYLNEYIIALSKVLLNESCITDEMFIKLVEFATKENDIDLINNELIIKLSEEIDALRNKNSIFVLLEEAYITSYLRVLTNKSTNTDEIIIAGVKEIVDNPATKPTYPIKSKR